MLGVERKWVVSYSTIMIGHELTDQHGLEEDIAFEMPNTGGVKVSVIEANHCQLYFPHGRDQS